MKEFPEAQTHKRCTVTLGTFPRPRTSLHISRVSGVGCRVAQRPDLRDRGWCGWCLWVFRLLMVSRSVTGCVPPLLVTDIQRQRWAPAAPAGVCNPTPSSLVPLPSCALRVPGAAKARPPLWVGASPKHQSCRPLLGWPPPAPAEL